MGKRRRLKSELDAVAGIGPKTRRALLSALGSVDQVLAASDEELLAIPGVQRRHVAALRQWRHQPPALPEATNPTDT